MTDAEYLNPAEWLELDEPPVEDEEDLAALQRDVDRLSGNVDVLQWGVILLALALIIQTVTLVMVGT